LPLQASRAADPDGERDHGYAPSDHRRDNQRCLEYACEVDPGDEQNRGASNRTGDERGDPESPVNLSHQAADARQHRGGNERRQEAEKSDDHGIRRPMRLPDWRESDWPLFAA
jgi:hypothetical protein